MRSVVREEVSYWEVPGLGSTRKESHWRSGWTSNHIAPTEFSSTHGKGISYGVIPGSTPYYYALHAPSLRLIDTSINASRFQPLINKSFTRLKEKVVGEQSTSVWMILGEGHESLRMITQRANTLHNAFAALRKGNVRRMAKALAVKPKKKHLRMRPKQVTRQASALWLEYHFGWSPFLSDMYDAALFLSRGWSVANRYKAGASSSEFRRSASFLTIDEASNRYYVCQGTDAIVSNPNKALVNRLGLANPLHTAWDLVPFSFMVDWVVDIGSFLGAFNCFYGYDLRHQFTTNMASGVLDYTYFPGPSVRSHIQERCFMYRRLGLTRPMPNLSIFDNVGDLLTKRGLTAVSLLVQVLTGRN